MQNYTWNNRCKNSVKHNCQCNTLSSPLSTLLMRRMYLIYLAQLIIAAVETSNYATTPWVVQSILGIDIDHFENHCVKLLSFFISSL